MRVVHLTRGAIAVVDEEDYALVSRFTWNAQVNGADSIYAYATVNTTEKISMSRLIMNPPDGMVVDHISGQTLDNRRCNLRICTAAENTRNRRKGRCNGKKRKGSRSAFKGVSYYNYAGKKRVREEWRAHIMVGGVKRHLGVFKIETDAARAYDTAAKQFFGPFARLNFPDDQSNVPPEAFFKPQENSECATRHSVPAKRHST